MAGSISFRADCGWWRIRWHHKSDKRTYDITKFKGERIYSPAVAKKALALMQSEVENGTFRIEKWLNNEWTDTIPYLWEWLEVAKGDLSPATYKDYKNSIKNHLIPFFRENPYQLHEIQYDVLRKLLNSIQRVGKGKANVMYCLHTCLSYAWKSRRIPEIPPFPEKHHYKIVEPLIQWLPEDRQLNVLKHIPHEHQPIFYWLKYHTRRICEAIALHKEDYDDINDSFIIRRSVSNRQLVDTTKTGKVHLIPCHRKFKPYMERLDRFSKFFFSCQTSRQPGKRYTQEIMSKIWRKACEKAGESIKMYAGLKHSTCSQMYNERDMSISEIQIVTDHARAESVKKYTSVELARKRALMETEKVVRIDKVKRRQNGKKTNGM